MCCTLFFKFIFRTFLKTEDNSERIREIYGNDKTFRVSIEEGKEKIIKKIRELLKKYKLEYNERLFIENLNGFIDSNMGISSFFKFKEIYDPTSSNTVQECDNAISANNVESEKNKNSEFSKEFLNIPKNIGNKAT
jgi:hypothetical protein